MLKPEHFTNHLHCEECDEHDRILRQHDRTSLRVEHVNNPGWDPLCFCSPHGKAYYMATLVRFALTNEQDEVLPYWQQLLFHLEGDGPNNALIAYCSESQRRVIGAFLEHLVESRADTVETLGSTEDVLRTHAYWSNAA